MNHAFSRALRFAVALAITTLASSPSISRAQDEASPPPPDRPPVEVAPTAIVPVTTVDTGASCASSAYPAARGSVVHVASGGRHGAGVLVIDGAHVATALSIVEQGHGIDVTDADGNERHARIILTADDDGLALLELDAPLAGRALPVADWATITIGQRVAVLAVPSHDAPPRAPAMARGTMPWAASEGIVSARGDRALQTDAAISAPIGSPIVACDGTLVGLVGRTSESPAGTYVSMPGAPALADLASRIDHPEGYGGRWNLTGGLTLSGAYEDPQWLWGAGITLGVVGLDAFVLATRFHYFWNDDAPNGSDVLSIQRQRFRGDAFVGWRQIVVLGRVAFHFELALGASVTRVIERTRRGEIDSTGPMPVLRWGESSAESWSVRPMGVINVLHGPVIISYTIEVDVDREHVLHVFDLGVRM